MKDLIEKLNSLSNQECAQLAGMLEKAWGVDASIPQAPVVSPPGDKGTPAPVDLRYDVLLRAFDANKKMGVIKTVRETVPGLGLAEAKKIVESAPKTIATNLSHLDAIGLQGKLQESGATVELQAIQ